MRGLLWLLGDCCFFLLFLDSFLFLDPFFFSSPFRGEGEGEGVFLFFRHPGDFRAVFSLPLNASIRGPNYKGGATLLLYPLKNNKYKEQRLLRGKRPSVNFR